MDLAMSLPNLSEEDIRKIRGYAGTNHTTLERVMETLLAGWLLAMEGEYTDAGSCPVCALRGVDSQLRGKPLVTAEKEGLITIGAGTDRRLLAGKLFAVCPKCLWWGVPDAA